MSGDQPFRIIVVLGLALFMPIGIYHRLKSRTGERLDRWQEGIFILFSLRLLGLAGLVGLLTWLINSRGMDWSSVSLPAWLRWIGVGLGVVAGCLLTWTFHTLGKNLTDTVVTRKVHTLVTAGPYRWVRHPLYVTVLILAFASFLTAANWFFLAACGAAFLLLAIRSRTEEAKLVERFGESYRAYCRDTGRFIPRIRKS